MSDFEVEPVNLPPVEVRDVGRKVDPLLAVMVGQSNGSGMSIELTLFLGGVIVSGRLAGGREYFERMDELVSSESNIKLADAMASFYPVEAQGDERDDQFIHLVDAQVVDTSGAMPSSGVHLWRCRVDAVDGWSIGRLSVG